MVLTASLLWLTVAAYSPNFGEYKLATGGALAWGDPLCIFVRFHPGTPMILGSDCVRGFVPTIDKARERRA